MTVPRPGGRNRWIRWIPLFLVTLGFLGLLTSLRSEPAPANDVAVEQPPPSSIPGTTTSTAIASTTTTTMRETSAPINQLAVGVVGEAPRSINLLDGPVDNQVFRELVAATQTAAMVWNPATLTPEAGVVSDVPSLDNGGLRYHDDGSVTVRYVIDQASRWNDGTSVSGEDFLFTASILGTDRRVATEIRSLYQLIDDDSWEVTSGSVSFTLSERTLEWTKLFSPLLPAHQLFDTDPIDDWQELAWVSAAPYYLASIDGNAYTLRPNSFHADADRLIDEVVVRVFPYEGALVGTMELGIVQVGRVSEPLVKERLAAIDDMEMVSGVGAEWEHIAFQFSSGRFVANVESLSAEPSFRAFAAGLVDRGALVDEFFGDTKQPLATITGMSWPVAAGAGWPTDVEDAEVADIREDLARETGSSPASVVYVTTEDLQRNLVATELVQSFAKYDFEVVIQLEEPGLFFNDTVIPGRFDVAEWAWSATPGPAGAVADLRTRFLTLPNDGGFNFYRWGSAGSDSDEAAFAEFESLMVAMQQEMDLDTLAGLLRQADDLLADQLVVVPIFADLVHAGVADHVMGFVVPAGDQPLLLGLGDWFISSSTDE